MLDVTKVLVISNEISEYQRIKSILDSLNFFQLNHQTVLKREDNYYDFVIVDLDSLDGHDELKTTDNLKLIYRRSNIILIGGTKESHFNRIQKGMTILSKPISEVELLEYLFNAILEEVSSI